MAKPIALVGIPSMDALLAEAKRQGHPVALVRRTGEVRIVTPWGNATCNARRKDGSRALIGLLREGQQRGL